MVVPVSNEANSFFFICLPIQSQLLCLICFQPQFDCVSIKKSHINLKYLASFCSLFIQRRKNLRDFRVMKFHVYFFRFFLFLQSRTVKRLIMKWNSILSMIYWYMMMLRLILKSKRIQRKTEKMLENNK